MFGLYENVIVKVSQDHNRISDQTRIRDLGSPIFQASVLEFLKNLERSHFCSMLEWKISKPWSCRERECCFPASPSSEAACARCLRAHCNIFVQWLRSGSEKNTVSTGSLCKGKYCEVTLQLPPHTSYLRIKIHLHYHWPKFWSHWSQSEVWHWFQCVQDLTWSMQLRVSTLQADLIFQHYMSAVLHLYLHKACEKSFTWPFNSCSH